MLKDARKWPMVNSFRRLADIQDGKSLPQLTMVEIDQEQITT